jgi:hypothetical protein
LTENHIPPQAVGNFDHWNAQSYLTVSAADRELFYGRRFNGGLRFKTLCAECNNGLGGKEDKAIINFFERVRKLLNSRVILLSRMQVPARPNQILAHLVSANESGVPSAFDVEARELFFGKKSLSLSSWNLFYWIYLCPNLFLMRNAYYTVWHPTVTVTPIQVLKFFPLAFMFTQEPWFFGLPNMRSFLRSEDDEVVDLPVELQAKDGHPVWPVVPESINSILLAGNSFGLIGEKE